MIIPLCFWLIFRKNNFLIMIIYILIIDHSFWNFVTKNFICLIIKEFIPVFSFFSGFSLLTEFEISKLCTLLRTTLTTATAWNFFTFLTRNTYLRNFFTDLTIKKIIQFFLFSPCLFIIFQNTKHLSWPFLYFLLNFFNLSFLSNFSSFIIYFSIWYNVSLF